jgi:hypothetical protein
VVVHLFLGLTMSGPIVHPDEAAYVGTAHQLLSGTGLLYSHSPYQPGYSLLLVPVVALFPAALRAYHAILILNAMLLAGVGAGVFLLSRHFVPRRQLGTRLLVAVVVASYPAYLAYSNLMISMNLFIPGFVLLCAVLGVALRRDRVAPWFLCGAIAAGLYLVHPLGIAAMVGLPLIALTVNRRRLLATLVALVLGMQLSLVPGLLLMQHLVRANTQLARPMPLSKTAVLAIAPPTNPSGTGTVQKPATAPGPPPQSRTRDLVAPALRNLSAKRLVNNLISLAGQVFYLAAGTYGLWLLGMGAAAAATWRVYRRKSRTTADRLAAFIGLTMALTLALASLKFNTGRSGTGEADELIYGRYNELVMAPVLALGLVQLARWRTASWRRLTLWPLATGVVLAGAGAALYAGRSHSALHQVFVDVNVLALHPLLAWFGGIAILPIALIAFGAATTLSVLYRRIGLVGAAVPVIALCALSASFSANRMARDSDGRASQRVVLTALHQVESRSGPLPPCVGYDLMIERVWHLANDQVFLPTTEFKRFNSFGEQPCSDVVISGRSDLDLTYVGARLVTFENFSPTKLWVLPGPRLDELSAAGLLLPARFPAVLPSGAFHSKISLVGVAPGPSVLPHGGGRDLVLAVMHDGTSPPTSPWPSRYGFTEGDGWVRLAVVWVARSNPLAPLAEASADLPRTMFPGETLDVRIHLSARDVNGVPLPPGSYFVRIGLVQEGFSFFADKGVPTLDLAVDVAPPVSRK